MSEFLHTIPLVNRGIKVRCKELHYYAYKNLVKTVLNDSDEDLDFFITELLQDLITNYDGGKLDIIDKFTILTYLRCVNVDPKVSLESTCLDTSKEYAVEVDLIDLLTRIDDIKLEKNTTLEYGDLIINFQLPRSFINHNVYEICASSIASVFYGGKEVKVGDYDFNIDRTKLLQGIPAKIMSQFRRFISRQDSKLREFNAFATTSPFTSRTSYFKLSLQSNTMLNLIKYLYTDNFQSLYDLEHHIFGRMNLPYNVIERSTLMEMQIFTNCNKDEAEPLPEEPPTVGTPAAPGEGLFD